MVNCSLLFIRTINAIATLFNLTSWSRIFDGLLNQFLFALKWVSLYLAPDISGCTSRGPWQELLISTFRNSFGDTVTFPSCIVIFPNSAVTFLQFLQTCSAWTHLKLCSCAKKPLLACNSAMNSPIVVKKRRKTLCNEHPHLKIRRIAYTKLDGQEQLLFAYSPWKFDARHSIASHPHSPSRNEES